MKISVKHGMRYAAEIRLSGFETMASDDDIINVLEQAGFANITVKTLDDSLRIIYGTWSRQDQVADVPDQIVYVEEAPE